MKNIIIFALEFFTALFCFFVLSIFGDCNFILEPIGTKIILIGVSCFIISLFSIFFWSIETSLYKMLMAIFLALFGFLIDNSIGPKHIKYLDSNYLKVVQEIQDNCDQSKWEIFWSENNKGCLIQRQTQNFYGTYQEARKKSEQWLEVIKNANQNKEISIDSFTFKAAPKEYVKTWCKKNNISYKDLKDFIVY